jgi:hypothetical protein
MSCITGRSRTCTKMCIFSSGVKKKGEMKSAEGNGRPSKQDAWSVEKFSITEL